MEQQERAPEAEYQKPEISSHTEEELLESVEVCAGSTGETP
jgi:hypothetical protein